jgi:hypothetical protein
MILNEELLSDIHFVQLRKQHQYEIISKHCVKIEERIRIALSRLEAERISADACLQFEKECPSMLLRNALIHRVEELIAKYWSHKK